MRLRLSQLSISSAVGRVISQTKAPGSGNTAGLLLVSLTTAPFGCGAVNVI